MAAYVYEDGTGWTPLTSSQLPASGVAAGTYGDGTHVGRFTVDAHGLVTAASNVAIAGGGGSGVVFGSDEVDASQTTNSAAYTDLATAGPSFSITVGASGLLLVGWVGQLSSAAAMSVALSGANTIPASDNYALFSNTVDAFFFGITHVFTGLTPGATTVTAKYRSTSGASRTFVFRSAWGIAP